MDKTFEDAFMEIQTEMVQIGVDLAEKAAKKADRIYILCCFGSNFTSLSTNIFFKVGNRILHNGKMGIAEKNNGNLNVLRDFFDGEEAQMMALKRLCKNFGKPVPYDIRLVYDLVTEEFEADYGYEPIPEGILSDDLYDAWMAEEQAKYPFDPSEQDQPEVKKQPAVHEPSHNAYANPTNSQTPYVWENQNRDMFNSSPKVKAMFADIDKQIEKTNKDLAKLYKPKKTLFGFEFPFFWKK